MNVALDVAGAFTLLMLFAWWRRRRRRRQIIDGLGGLALLAGLALVVSNAERVAGVISGTGAGIRELFAHELERDGGDGE